MTAGGEGLCWRRDSSHRAEDAGGLAGGRWWGARVAAGGGLGTISPRVRASAVKEGGELRIWDNSTAQDLDAASGRGCRKAHFVEAAPSLSCIAP